MLPAVPFDDPAIIKVVPDDGITSRTAWPPASVTASAPDEKDAIPEGKKKDVAHAALSGAPSPPSGRPENVVTTPSGVTARMQALP